MNDKFMFRKIGQVRLEAENTFLDILPPFRLALKGLEQFSHVIVFGWVDQEVLPGYPDFVTRSPECAQDRLSGVFATRFPFRPNPLLSTVCKIESVDHKNGSVQIQTIDMFDGTPLIDLKPYYPVVDQVPDARIPQWLADWPNWAPQEGIGFEPYEIKVYKIK